MNRPSLLVIVRHAESIRNAIKDKAGSIYFVDDESRAPVKGIPDHKIEITDLGRKQAQETGVALKKKFGVFDYAYHSGYRRTEQTLTELMAGYSTEARSQTKIRQNLFIRERDPGYGYDMTKTEARKAFPWLREYWKTVGGWFAHPPGGESLAQVAERVYLFLNMLFRDRGGKKVLVVTHGGTLRCLRFLLERWSYDQALQWTVDQRPKNCGVTTYRYSGKTKSLLLEKYNEVFWK
ncbi:MAG: putative phosphoglycerate mutase [Parcubacteria group bacterium Gr01-1014_3]|nr:MAG: putative phosphoglycerate mutase [Parcubacteria group bacterium Gr01-1014_3]